MSFVNVPPVSTVVAGSKQKWETTVLKNENLRQIYSKQANDNANHLLFALHKYFEQYQFVQCESGMLHIICEYYIELFKSVFYSGLNLILQENCQSEVISEAHQIIKRNRFSFDNHFNYISTFELEEDQFDSPSNENISGSSNKYLSRKLSIDDNVFYKEKDLCNVNSDLEFYNKKKINLARYNKKRVGKHDKGWADVEKDTCFDHSSCSKFGKISSLVRNRFRKSSHAPKLVKDTSSDGLVKLEEICEYRARSSTDTHNISPFFKAKILLRTNSDIYQLEIYSPIKSSRPKHVIHGFEVLQVRPVEAARIQESDCCFVLKSINHEFVIKFTSRYDVLVWITEIDDANIRSGNTHSQIYECYKHPYIPEVLKNEESCQQTEMNNQQSFENRRSFHNHQENESTLIENRSFDESINFNHSSFVAKWENIFPMFDDEADRRDSHESSSTGCSSLSSTTDSTETVTDCCSVVESVVVNREHLSVYPWFHGNLSRSNASLLIANLKNGVFLLRYSANQRCFAITFSYHGKAKHQRLTVDVEGRCRVNNKNFFSVNKMLQFHHKFPITVDSTAASNPNRVLLSDFVLNKIKFPHLMVSPKNKPKNNLPVSLLNSNTELNSEENLTQQICTDNVSYINHSVAKIDERSEMIKSSEIDEDQKKNGNVYEDASITILRG